MLAILLVGGSGCYGHRLHQPARTVRSPHTAAELVVVEADDRGNFWNAAQADTALRLVQTRAAAGPTAVVLFVHGWGHNATPHNQNLACFSHTLDFLSRRLSASAVGVEARAKSLEKASSIELRAKAASTAPINVVGIYVGWRGKSLPEAPGPLFALTRLFTFWGRKRTAALVGRGDTRALISTLGALHDSLTHRGPSGRSPDSLFTLVSVGHSFGGQLLFPAVADRIEDSLQRAAGAQAWRALRGQRIVPADSVRVTGLGDLVVLVNPALEAGAFERMDRLARQLRFSSAQTPLLAVFSASNDLPNKLLFPIGRALTTTLPPTSERGQRGRDLRALGRYGPQVTHRMEWNADSAIETRVNTKAARVRDTPFEQPARNCEYSGDAAASVRDGLATAIANDPAATDLTADRWINGKHLIPVRGGQRQPFAPLMVVQTRSTRIIDNHNGFFTPEFVDFLTRYVVAVQDKRYGMGAAR